KIGEQRAVLEQEPHPPAQRVKRVSVERGDVVAIDTNGAGVRTQLTGYEAQQRGLGSAAGSNEGGDPAAWDVDVHAIREHLVAAAIPEAAYLDQNVGVRHALPCSHRDAMPVCCEDASLQAAERPMASPWGVRT